MIHHQRSRSCQTETNELHQFFQAWFNGTILSTDENFNRLSGVLGQSFVLVNPDGVLTRREPLLAGLRNAYKSRNNFKIWIENFQLHTLENGIALTTYQEWQQDSGGTITTRISTALFKKKAGTPNGIEGLHVHETWLVK